jgi:hypothetical protein
MTTRHTTTITVPTAMPISLVQERITVSDTVGPIILSEDQNVHKLLQ